MNDCSHISSLFVSLCARFCNEFGNRAYVTDRMLSHDPYYAESNKWNAESEVPTFSLVLSSSTALDGKKHVDMYSHKGLLKRIEGIQELADWMGQDVETIRSTLVQYQQDATKGTDEWGKTSFRGVPADYLTITSGRSWWWFPILPHPSAGCGVQTCRRARCRLAPAIFVRYRHKWAIIFYSKHT